MDHFWNMREKLFSN